ncbi:MAG: GNAT family N-acetyltransferase, partial [Chitinophagaceae bacterium]|nr:GNAT family N-acetyltransferase [Chitinophagaceae bacterium]
MAPQAFILPSAQIDAARWDECVERSANGLVYSSTAYLHAMADNWHGVVIDDYRAVMAIPWRMKFGFRYAYTPPFVQQLGLTGDFNEADLKAVIRTLPDFVKLADIHFNFSNTMIAALHPVSVRTNFVLDLSKGYTELQARYRKDLKENLRRLPAHELVFGEGSVEEGVSMYRQEYGNRITAIDAAAYDRFTGLCRQLQEQGKCIIKYIAHRNEKVAVVVLLKDGRRIYNIMNTTTAAGRKLNANDALLDHVLHAFSGQIL